MLIISALLFSHAILMSITFTHFRLTSKLVSMIKGQQNISVPNLLFYPEDKFQRAYELILLLVNSGNKVRLQKLVKEQSKRHAAQVHARGHHIL